MTFNSKLHLLWIIAHGFAAYALFTNFSWYFLAIAYAWYVVIKGLGSEIGAHRLFTHCSFETAPWKAKALLWLQTLCGEGSVLSFVGTHRAHHAFADTPRDPHSPHFKPWWKITYFIDPVDVSPRFVKDILRTSHGRAQHETYFLWHGILVALGFGFPVEYGYLVALPILFSTYTNALVNIGLHRWGDQILHNNDKSRNNSWINIVLYGAGYHANHHFKPQNYRFHPKWWRDPIGAIIGRLFI